MGAPRTTMSYTIFGKKILNEYIGLGVYAAMSGDKSDKKVASEQVDPKRRRRARRRPRSSRTSSTTLSTRRKPPPSTERSLVFRCREGTERLDGGESAVTKRGMLNK